MPLWQSLLNLAGVVLGLVLIYGIALVIRRRVLSRHGGTFELSYRVRSDRAGRGWVLGVGRYSGDLLEFFRIFSALPRAMRTLDRADLTYEGQRQAAGAEGHALYAGHVIIALSTPAGPVELAMSPGALTGFQAWLEGAPPGRGRRTH